MKAYHLSSPIILFLLPAISTAVADTASANRPPPDPSIAPLVTNPKTILSGEDGSAAPKILPKGTQDVPIDGQDGRPHAGPWVETSGERDRKKLGTGGTQEGNSAAHASASTLGHVGPDGMPYPHSNDGVMDDRNRQAPKEGTRGMAGGISEKQKENRLSGEKLPGGPKEAPPLPHSEQQKLPTNDYTGRKESKPSESASDLGKLEKPADLPDRPHDIPHPKAPVPSTDDPLGIKTSGTSIQDSWTGDSIDEEPVNNPLHSLLFSFTMIVFSEIGDKTFLVAALMAMRHPRLVVLSAASCALIGMTILSAILGHAVPTLIPKTFTKALAAMLFFIFGLKMLKEGREMSPDEGVGEEMKEVEMELEEKEQQQLRMNRRRSSVTPHNLEAGRGEPRKSRSSVNRLPSPPESVSSSSSRESSPGPTNRLSNFFVGLNNLFSLLLSPAWVQTFAMTFLGEWGDRSQIATIAMAAGQDYWWVTIGATVAHCLCTAVAVVGGSAIAGKVSMRVVTLGGSVTFLIFGVIYLIEAVY